VVAAKKRGEEKNPPEKVLKAPSFQGKNTGAVCDAKTKKSVPISPAKPEKPAPRGKHRTREGKTRLEYRKQGKIAHAPNRLRVYPTSKTIQEGGQMKQTGGMSIAERRMN